MSASGTGSSNTITFSSIPSTYKHLQIRFASLSTGAADWVNIRLNNDSTSANYYGHKLYGTGSGTPVATSMTGQPYLYLQFIGGSTTQPSVGVTDILDYASTSKYKTTRTLFGWDTNGGGEIDLVSGLYSQTTAINRIDLILASSNFATTAKFALYGIKG
jgi:hypothetical protein